MLDHASLGVENAGHEDEVLVVRRNVQTDLVASDLVQDLGARGLLRQKHVDVVAGILYRFKLNVRTGRDNINYWRVGGF